MVNHKGGVFAYLPFAARHKNYRGNAGYDAAAYGGNGLAKGFEVVIDVKTHIYQSALAVDVHIEGRGFRLGSYLCDHIKKLYAFSTIKIAYLAGDINVSCHLRVDLWIWLSVDLITPS